jgi:hypothetical protein
MGVGVRSFPWDMEGGDRSMVGRYGNGLRLYMPEVSYGDLMAIYGEVRSGSSQG